ncbi:dynamin family protein [Angustibacter peucedani]
MKDQSQREPLLDAVERLRAAVDGVVLPLDVDGASEARRDRAALVDQLDDYVLPRLRSLDAPLLAVVGGSTGAGKSTLVNSVLRRRVSRSGVLRPTTRSPVLVHHPDDAAWFEGPRVLASLDRITGDETATAAADPTDDDTRITAVRLAASDALPAGLALLDAPDIDSVVRANRELAQQLLAAADLWIFVTTASRYADAVPWDLLRGAADRGASVAIVLDRVPPEALLEVRTHLAGMLRERGLTSSPLFTVPESAVDDEGLLDPEVVRPVRSWLVALARDAQARQVVVRRTLSGAMDQLRARSTAVADAVSAQGTARAALAHEVDETYARARQAVEQGLQDGSLLRGEVLARWQEFVGTGELLRTLEAKVGRLRDRVTAAVTGRPAPEDDIGEALQTGVEALLTSQTELAARDTWNRWRAVVGGAQLAAAHPELATPGAHLDDRAARTVRDWQGYVLELVSSEGSDKRVTARFLSYGVNGLGVLLMLVVFSHTAGLSGAEVGIAGGTAVLAQRLLEAVFGDQAVRTLAAKAQTDLMRRADQLLADDRQRFDAVLAGLGEGSTADHVLRAQQAVEAGR